MGQARNEGDKPRPRKVGGKLQFTKKGKKVGASSPEKVNQAKTDVMRGSGPDDQEEEEHSRQGTSICKGSVETEGAWCSLGSPDPVCCPSHSGLSGV